MGKRIKRTLESGTAVDGTGERELQPLDDDEPQASSLAKSTTAPLVLPAPVRSLASAPPLSSDSPSSRPSAKRATSNALLAPAYTGPPPSAHIAPLQPVYTIPAPHFRVGSLLTQYEQGVQELLTFHDSNKDSWDHIVGWYCQEFGRSPSEIIGPPIAMWAPAPAGWERDLGKLDALEKGIIVGESWSRPARGTTEEMIISQVEESDAKRQMFEAAIRRWANSHKDELSPVLKKAGFTKDLWTNNWFVMRDLKRMDEGPLKEGKLALAKAESPRFYERCMNDETCGKRRVRKRKDGEDCEVEIVHGKDGYRETVVPPKRQKLMSDQDIGRPTQIHNMPWDERAENGGGERLPWAHKSHLDHPNARGQKRHHEEKGPFGKYNRRQRLSRVRAAKMAKKEDPAVEAFEVAMTHDDRKAVEEVRREALACSRSQNIRSTTFQNPSPSVIKEPTQVILYGYSPKTLWAAVSFYETVSSGIICEDYEREPPPEHRNRVGLTSNVSSRALTKAEKVLVRQYHGGHCWIKVTFDSTEAAERAICSSPHLLQGHWVYAEPFRGIGPEVDEPILMREEDRGQSLLGTPRRAYRPSETASSAVSPSKIINSRGGIYNFPGYLTDDTKTEVEAESAAQQLGQSSSATASSSAATTPTVEHTKLRKRRSKQPRAATTISNNTGTDSEGQAPILQPLRPPPARDPHLFTYFPTLPRTILRPAHEAFLPASTWFEATIARLTATGWLPDDMIGDAMPRLESGEFDWERASLYWKVFYWIDAHFGTDYCGVKDD